MTTKEKLSTYDSSAGLEGPLATYDKPFIGTESLQEKELAMAYDLDRAFLEAAEEMRFDWPEFAPAERIKAGIMEIAFGLLLFAALVGLPGVIRMSTSRFMTTI